MSNNQKGQIIVALDVPSYSQAIEIVDSLGDSINIYKVGSQMFTAYGPMLVRHLISQGKRVFLDLKFHDIPNTVASAVESAVGLNILPHDLPESKDMEPAKDGLFMLTIHTCGGPEMMERSVQAATKASETLGVSRPKIVGITVLTSDSKTDNIQDLVLQRAKSARQSGLDGVVCSSQEAALIRREFGKDFIIVTPGIRPSGEELGDQKRVTTPKEAVVNGSNFLVVGRPIVKANNPKQAAEQILEEIR